ncbi:MAG: hypothetical protein JRN11_06190 [Nitrososphaerota archaeon]|nr:hypothetical protein [Nitrososphaerota archaeon]
MGAQEIRKEQPLLWSLWSGLVIAAQVKRAKIGEIYSNDDFDRIERLKRIFRWLHAVPRSSLLLAGNTPSRAFGE